MTKLTGAFLLHTCVSLLANLATVGAITSPGLPPDKNVAVCKLPPCASLEKISSRDRGIYFTACTDRPTEPNLATVWIKANFGMQQQLWDTGTSQLDTYWLNQYLKPRLGCQPNFNAVCWEKPKKGCSMPPPPPPPSPPQPPRPAKKARVLPASAEKDTDLLPLADPSLAP